MPSPSLPAKPLYVDLEHLGESPGVFTMDALADIVLITWYGVSTVEAMPMFEALCMRLGERFPRGMSCAQLITTEHPRMPDAAARAELTRINQTYEKLAACCAVVIPVKGFVGSALRGLVTAIVLHARPSHADLKIVGSLREAAEWLGPAHRAKLGSDVDIETLFAAMLQVTAPR